MTKATKLLRNQHRRLERLVNRLGGSGRGRPQLVRALVEELMTHLAIEDHCFLDAVAEGAGLRVDRFREQHADLRNAVLQAVFAENDDRVFAERLRELDGAVRGHVRAVERELVPVVESRIRAEELDAMGLRMQESWNAIVRGGRPLRVMHPHAAR